MPTYSYACRDCGRAFDIVQSFKDASLTECPSCQGSLRKLFNSVGIVFKGSGFYRNDSRSGSDGSAAGSGTKAESKATSESTSQSKPTTSSDGGSSSAPASTSSTSSTSSTTSSGSTSAKAS